MGERFFKAGASVQCRKLRIRVVCKQEALRNMALTLLRARGDID